jgi:hypothetical protein
MSLAHDSEFESSQAGEPKRSQHLHPADPDQIPNQTGTGGSGASLEDAAKIVDVLRGMADQEFHIAERISSKARQAFALAAAVFTIAQTIAFGNFETANLTVREEHRILALAISAIVFLFVAVLLTIQADATFRSRDLPLDKLESDLNAAYEGDRDVLGRLGSYYLGVVRTRRRANTKRRRWYQASRWVVAVALAITVAELIVSLLGRVS